MSETFFNQNENELTSEYHIPENEDDAPAAKDAQALQNVASNGENEGNGNDGEYRGDENSDEENYDILSMLNEIKKDLLSENEKLQQQNNQNVHAAEGEDGDKPDRNTDQQSFTQPSNQDNHARETKNATNESFVPLEESQHGEEVRVSNNNDSTEENAKKLVKEETQVEGEPLEKELNASHAQVNNPDAAPNEQSQENVSSKKGAGRPYKKTKNISSDAKSTTILSKGTPKKRKLKNGPNTEYATLAMHPLHPAYLANLAKVNKTNNTLIDDQIEYLRNCEFLKQKYLKGIAKKSPKIKSDKINIDICYSSRSEKSMDESEREAEEEGGSSIDSMEEFYENICQSDMPLDFYKNSLSTKQELKEVKPEYFINTGNSVTDEIQILNKYIKEITECQQKNSSSIDVDNKLLNILSLSFLTFIDHVIYDSHIYALKREFTKEAETDKRKKNTNDGIDTPNGNCQKECVHENRASERTEEINIVGGNTSNDVNMQNDPGKDKTGMCSPKHKSVSLKNSQDDQRKELPRDIDLLDNSYQAEKKETTHNGDVSTGEYGRECTTEGGDKMGTEVIYTPDVINLCLTNLYNQELVNRIMNQKITEGNANGVRPDNLKGSTPNTSKLIHNHTIEATAHSENQEKTHLKESVKEMDSKNGALPLCNDSLQMNINQKLNKRQIIINKINEKIKKKSVNSLQSCVNSKKYSLDDLFEL
ncbi:conserved Plasmodium protein, unknown function [Plasmodium knowlesi strain H]|uniref:Uncharacterized protein n=3 Tax=Plasmodium knowlesi TaxID=5850 RepID=A0A5K1U3J6_PLAKH|nr:conserved Plasmodium protein, unknown function [Plasmodium knowlesi strain H]OTN63840.1 Uncharacterized protein PKNOH_S140290500 [Plasmodium knowlesi]CAA9991315.1 conserved Plasmodium protein, unknown function [Plasmodium knowlesi strain H]SBO26425.1 conserved Plasmodium protein, unknown function [Plasmodium knowlesi strain H]SBO28978.1 conserved Plasmodium protein, unknown function [Plasmodium knowlesi strain H]VVS80789.1 conserved Plasmodium protein, unknown function [Plasmodium knowlesi |eukprot:XP_002262594.1 hypothetical protein, conserved in Plasmodium species [Plasmodium knowlesi strain H]